MTRPTPFQKGSSRNCRGIHMPRTGLAVPSVNGAYGEISKHLCFQQFQPSAPSLTAAGVSDDHHQTEDINLASAKRRHFEIGSAPASIALALFVASTRLTRPSCGHRNVDATSIKISATNSHEVTEGVPLPNTDTLFPRRQPGHQRSSPSKNVRFV